MNYYLILIMALFLSSCETVETTKFRFRDENHKLEASLDILEDNLDMRVANTISTNQIYQGMNTDLGIRSMHDKEIFIDSITAFIELKNQTFQAVISKSFAQKKEFKFPVSIEPGGFKHFNILIQNQEDLEIEIGDSLNLQINLYHTDGIENNATVVVGTKHYEKYEYVVMP